MGSNFNFNNFGTDPPAAAGGDENPPAVNFPLMRQHSIYSLTFDEFQSTVGGIGKDFGSMNMDELLKSIWSAEENQNIGSSSGAAATVDGGGQEGSGYLQRQGSLTLPRTLSLKTVDEVWRDMSKEYGAANEAAAAAGGGGGGGGGGGFSVPHRQPTLGEVTLEEFLVRAGVVRDESQVATKPNNVGLFGDLPPAEKNSGLEFGFQATNGTVGLMGGTIAENRNQIVIASESANVPLNVNGGPKKPTSGNGVLTEIPGTNHVPNPGIRNGIIPIPNPTVSHSMTQNVTLQNGRLGMVGLGSPAISSDGFSKSNGDTSSVSPVPYAFNGGSRGRRTAPLEKVVERRQRRMIKNRESAARSRARKQAYTTELEAEIAKLKEENEELRKRQAEMIEMHKNQEMEMMNQQRGTKRRRLRRTQTGPL